MTTNTNTNSNDWDPATEGINDPCVGCAYVGGWEATAIKAPDDCNDPNSDNHIHTSVELYLSRSTEEGDINRACTSYIILTLLREDIDHSNQDLLNDTLPLTELLTIPFPAGVGGVRVEAEFPKILADEPTLGVGSLIQGMGELRVEIQPYRWNFGEEEAADSAIPIGEDPLSADEKAMIRAPQIDLNLNFDDMKAKIHKLDDSGNPFVIDTPIGGGLRG